MGRFCGLFRYQRKGIDDAILHSKMSYFLLARDDMFPVGKGLGTSNEYHIREYTLPCYATILG